MIGMHTQDTADAFFLPFRRVEYIRARLQRTRIDTEECEFADEGVGHNFKCQGGERFLVVRFPFSRFFRFRNNALYRRNVQRRRHIIDNGIKQHLYALVLVSGTAEHGEHGVRYNRFANGFLYLVNRQLFTFQVFSMRASSVSQIASIMI